MANLTNVPTQALYDELYRRSFDPNSEVFSVSLWVKEDVETIVPSDKVDEFMQVHHKYFDDCLTASGWEILEDLD
jgi:hypothetical protein